MLWLLIFLVGFSAPNVSSGDPEGLQLEAISIEHLNNYYISAKFSRSNDKGVENSRSFHDPLNTKSDGRKKKGELEPAFMQFVICPSGTHSRLSNACLMKLVKGRQIHFQVVKEDPFVLADFVYNEEAKLVESGRFTLCLLDATATLTDLSHTFNEDKEHLKVVTTQDILKHPRHCYQVTIDNATLEARKESKREMIKEAERQQTDYDTEVKKMKDQLRAMTAVIKARKQEIQELDAVYKARIALCDAKNKEVEKLRALITLKNYPRLDLIDQAKDAVLAIIDEVRDKHIPNKNAALEKYNDKIVAQNKDIADRKVIMDRIGEINALKKQEVEAELALLAALQKAVVNEVKIEEVEDEDDEDELAALLQTTSLNKKRRKRAIEDGNVQDLANQQLPEQTFLARMVSLDLIPEVLLTMDELKAKIQSITNMDPEELINNTVKELREKLTPFKEEFEQIAVKKQREVAAKFREEARQKFGPELSDAQLYELFPALQQLKSKIERIEKKIEGVEGKSKFEGIKESIGNTLTSAQEMGQKAIRSSIEFAKEKAPKVKEELKKYGGPAAILASAALAAHSGLQSGQNNQQGVVQYKGSVVQSKGTNLVVYGANLPNTRWVPKSEVANGKGVSEASHQNRLAFLGASPSDSSSKALAVPGKRKIQLPKGADDASKNPDSGRKKQKKKAESRRKGNQGAGH